MGLGSGAGTTALQLGTMVWATGNGITVGVTGSVLKGHSVTFEGSAPLTDVGDMIVIRYASATASGGYVTATEASVSSTGTFSTVWTANASGQLAFTAVLVPPGATPAANPLSIGVSILVFKSAIATIYGPGLWGHRTACGERLRKTTLGVANRTLKCGTKVAVYYGNRELVVPVIDRGPFSNHASWDLTEATAKALGANHTVTVGTIAPWSPLQQSSARS
jgi:rare lipoprotein A